MNKKIKKEWVKALRSGEYKQGKGALKAQPYDVYGNKIKGKPEHCCLGVLCEIAVKHGVLKDPKKYDKDGYYFGDFDDTIGEKNQLLPKVVMDWARLDNNNPYLGESRASDLNDEGCSFQRIADLIEEEL